MVLRQYYIFKDCVWRVTHFFYKMFYYYDCTLTLLITLSTLIAKHISLVISQRWNKISLNTIQFSVMLPSNLQYLARQVFSWYVRAIFWPSYFRFYLRAIRKRRYYRYEWDNAVCPQCTHHHFIKFFELSHLVAFIIHVHCYIILKK